MKKLVGFLAGIILLAFCGVAIYVAGAIFDAGRGQQITPYFFQPNNLSERRPGTPKTAAEIGESEFLELLVRRYVAEYFYAAPDPENIARRTGGQSTLALMSTADVFNEWRQGEAVTIKNLAADKAMRIAHVIDKIYKPNNSQYWVVNYALVTWVAPNNFDVPPVVSRGTLYMKIEYAPTLRQGAGVDIDTLHDYLERGGDPAAVFQFTVTEIQGL